LFAALIDGNGNENKNEDEDVDDGAKDFGDASTGSRIAVLPSTAFAITLAARNIMDQHRKKRKDCAVARGRIIVLQDQFDSAIYPWQQVCDESEGKVSLDIVGHPEGHPEADFHHEPGSSASTNGNDGFGVGGATGWTRAILEKLTGSSQADTGEIIAACLPVCHWADGTLIDLEAIGAACSDRNIPLIVDATQGTFAFVSRPCWNGESHGFFGSYPVNSYGWLLLQRTTITKRTKLRKLSFQETTPP
jgi:hypothetical protein